MADGRQGGQGNRGRSSRPDRRASAGSTGAAGAQRRNGRADRPAARREPRGGSSASAPVIDEEVTGRELDKEIRHELSTLDGPVAGTVARHMVMAGRLMDSDAELAHRHMQHARAMAGRVAVVREAAGYAAYNAEHFDVALTEFRAARRISGHAEFLAVMADCERGVGRPEKALELADDEAAQRLSADSRAELLIVTAGALRDLGREEEALALLQRSLAVRLPREQWVARVQYALGDLLAQMGQTQDAVAAFAAAEAGDVEGSLDAGERVVELLEP